VGGRPLFIELLRSGSTYGPSKPVSRPIHFNPNPDGNGTASHPGDCSRARGDREPCAKHFSRAPFRHSRCRGGHGSSSDLHQPVLSAAAFVPSSERASVQLFEASICVAPRSLCAHGGSSLVCRETISSRQLPSIIAADRVRRIGLCLGIGNCTTQRRTATDEDVTRICSIARAQMKSGERRAKSPAIVTISPQIHTRYFNLLHGQFCTVLTI
jgi:hypothetical protein